MQAPNLRSLNLNYNALKDLRPLLGMLRLQKVYLAGNRISRLRRTAAVFERIGKELVEADLRSNPLTVGFYTPQPHSRNSSTSDQQLALHPSSYSSASPSDDDDHTPDPAPQHLLPPLSKAADTASRERLDEDTKLRRRVYEMLVVCGCKRLKVLDGLEVDRGGVVRKDGVWERLREVGVLRVRGQERNRHEGGEGDEDKEGF